MAKAPSLCSTGKRALFEKIQRPALVGFLGLYRDAMIKSQRPRSSAVRRAAPALHNRSDCRREAGMSGRTPASRVECVPSYNIFRHRCIDNRSPTVRPVSGAVTLSAHRAVELPYPGSVEVRCIDLRNCIVEHRGKDFKTTLHQVPRCIIIRKVNPVEQVCTVPGIRKERSRPAHARKGTQLSGGPSQSRQDVPVQ